MQLIELSSITAEEVAMLSPELLKRDINDLLVNSSQFFLVTNRHKPLVLGGLMVPSMISNLAYVWMVLRPKKYEVQDIRRGIVLARRYLAKLPWEIFAEINPRDERNRKFARAVGFVKIDELDDRDLYKWSK